MTPPIDFGEMFHVGVRVADLDLAMADMGAALGLEWSEPQQRRQRAWLPAEGAVELDLRFTYSRQGPVHIELLEGPAGSVWDGRQQPGPHHVGVWVDDVRSLTDSLLDDGWALELAAVSPDEGYGAFTYVRSPSGTLVEPVSTAVRPAFERWWDGGPLG